ncbi:mas-related G-protein coupled receptor member B4-like [Scomber japonicus]|uniref:mas-related G-protein coupled receptor member B4-like n=1 Tax=Scomber japonicus TaxID=13676 RepID=UPI002305EEC7|nr:mas-related G-protein coupled receptor member B4-like [Scomber japonicus]
MNRQLSVVWDFGGVQWDAISSGSEGPEYRSACLGGCSFLIRKHNTTPHCIQKVLQLSKVHNNNITPIFVINVFIADLIQICSMIIFVANVNAFFIKLLVHSYGLIASVGFMVCVAMERYLIIVWPLWYHCNRSIKASVLVCVVIWIISITGFPIFFSVFPFVIRAISFFIFLFLPFPLLIFFLAETLKSLSAAISVSPEEKRRIVGTMVLVLLNYIMLFVHTVILVLRVESVALYVSIGVSIHISPLVEMVLYIFSSKGATDSLLACRCCCTMGKRCMSVLAEQEGENKNVKSEGAKARNEN